MNGRRTERPCFLLNRLCEWINGPDFRPPDNTIAGMDTVYAILRSVVAHAVRGFVDGLREQLETIWEQQWDVTWRNLVHERFQHRNSRADTRQRHVVLDLGREWVEVGRITELTPRLAKAYAGKTTKTLQRDLNALAAMELIARDGRNVRARRDVILAFLPLRKKLESSKKPTRRTGGTPTTRPPHA